MSNVRQHVLDRLADVAAPGPSGVRDIELHFDPKTFTGRYLSVALLDDDTTSFREVSGHDTREDALDALTDPGELLVGEYLIDLHAPDLQTAVTYGTDNTGAWQPAHTIPFHEDHLPFA